MAGLNFRKKRWKINYKALRDVLVWVGQMALAFVIACILVVNFGSMISNVGQSMEPTMSSGDRVLVNKLRYKVTTPKRGNIIVFQPNGNTNTHFYIKRVVGLPGETIQIIDGFIYVDGEVLVEDVKLDKMTQAGLAEEPVILGEDEYFVLGDNRNFSDDSRNADIGNINLSDISGQAWFLAAPFSRFGFLK